MNAHQLAGKPAPRELLANIPRLVSMYYAIQPDPDEAGQLVAFGTSGHRGTSVDGTFNEEHILAISQAICEYRRTLGADGPLFLGMDTHALSEPALNTAIEVFAANGVAVRRPGAATRRRPSSRMPSSPTTGVARPAWPTA